MADYQAVGAMIQPVKPPDTLGSLSSILGIKQQQQALQGQAAVVQQEQLKAQAAQGLNTFTQSFDPSEAIGPDGTLDVDAVHKSDAYKGAGNAKPAIDEYIQAVKARQQTSKQALQTLDDATLTQMSRGVGALANDADVLADNGAGREKVKNFYRVFSQQSPEAARIAGLYGGVVQHAKQGDLSDAVYSQQLMGADVLGQRGQQNPIRGSNLAGAPTIANARTGATALAPLVGSGNIAPTPAEIASQNVRATGTGNADIDRMNEVSAAQKDSANAIPLTKRIDQLAHEISSGHLAKMISEGGNYLGFSDINQARSELNKDLGLVQGIAVGRAGSDNRAAELLKGYPTDTTPENTTHAAMDWIRGAARQNLARGRLLADFQKKDPNGVKGFNAADNLLIRTSDPLVHEYHAIKPEEQGAFLRRNSSTPQQAQELRNHANAVKNHTHYVDTPTDE